MNFFRNPLVRFPVIMIGFVAWLAISNHCALAGLEGAAKMPMPSCHESAPAGHSPDKHDKDGGVECCKVLRSTLLKPSSGLAAAPTLTFVPHDYLVALITTAEETRRTRVTEWDTGPPGADSFAETVLQRSILAHAPPSLA